MALGTLPPSSESWARWPAGADFGAIDAGMVPYQGRPGTLDPLQRRGQSEHFLPCAFTPAPLPSPPPGTQYHPPVTYAGYASHSLPAAMDTPLRPPLASHGLTLETDAGRGGGQETWHGFPSAERSQSPSIKSETQMSAAASTSSLSPKLPKTIIPNVRVFGAPEHKADTAVDNLLKILQTKYGFRELSEETDTDRESEESEECDGVRGRPKTNRKPYRCDIPGCTKAFAQKNNLETHRRAHTGECPYACPFWRECNARFTQRVNLRTHILRHLGIKPFKCPECQKPFAQRSNVKAHMKTHEKVRERFVCKLDNCNKSYTQKGNLKNHQNNSHPMTVAALKAKHEAITDERLLSEEDMEMVRYFLSVHNNANKGIKGRGKGRKVRRLDVPHMYPLQPTSEQSSPARSSPSPSTDSTCSGDTNCSCDNRSGATTGTSVTTATTTTHSEHAYASPTTRILPPSMLPPQLPSPLPFHHGGLGAAPGGYGLGRPGMVFDIDGHASAAAPTTQGGPAGGSGGLQQAYEEERELAFRDRMY